MMNKPRNAWESRPENPRYAIHKSGETKPYQGLGHPSRPAEYNTLAGAEMVVQHLRRYFPNIDWEIVEIPDSI